jgi:hypothetical protein
MQTQIVSYGEASLGPTRVPQPEVKLVCAKRCYMRRFVQRQTNGKKVTVVLPCLCVVNADGTEHKHTIHQPPIHTPGDGGFVLVGGRGAETVEPPAVVRLVRDGHTDKLSSSIAGELEVKLAIMKDDLKLEQSALKIAENKVRVSESVLRSLEATSNKEWTDVEEGLKKTASERAKEQLAESVVKSVVAQAKTNLIELQTSALKEIQKISEWERTSKIQESEQRLDAHLSTQLGSTLGESSVTIFYKLPNDDWQWYHLVSVFGLYLAFAVDVHDQITFWGFVVKAFIALKMVVFPAILCYATMLFALWFEFSGFSSEYCCCASSRRYFTRVLINPSLPVDAVFERYTKIPGYKIVRFYSFFCEWLLPEDILKMHDRLKVHGYTHFRQVKIDLRLLDELHKKHKGTNPSFNTPNNIWRDSNTLNPLSENPVSKDTIEYFTQQWLFITASHQAVLGNKGKAPRLN